MVNPEEFLGQMAKLLILIDDSDVVINLACMTMLRDYMIKKLQEQGLDGVVALATVQIPLDLKDAFEELMSDMDYGIVVELNNSDEEQ